MKIQILGVTGEGKTSIANLIHDLLISHGFEPTLINEEPVGDYTPHLRSMRKNNLKIEIETIQQKNVKI